MNIKISEESINLVKGEDGFWSFKIYGHRVIKVENIPTKAKAIERATEILQYELNQK